MSIGNYGDNTQKVEESKLVQAPIMQPPVPTELSALALAGQRITNVTTNAPNQEQQVLTVGRMNLRKWLGKTFRVVITDGRVLVGFFNCTDKDANVVLSMCAEYLEEGKDPRILGNVMIPGKHIVSIAVDLPKEESDSRCH